MYLEKLQEDDKALSVDVCVPKLQLELLTHMIVRFSLRVKRPRATL